MKEKSKNHIVSATSFVPDAEYTEWLGKIKADYLTSRQKAAMSVNSTILEFYWRLGRDIVEISDSKGWGSGVVEQLSLDLRAAFPGVTGFSSTNLWYIKKWYLFYSADFEKLPQAVGEIVLSQDGLKFPAILNMVPWGHHRTIITKCSSVEEAVFYLQQTLENNWSRSALENALEAGYYLSKGRALTNFETLLPTPQGKLAQDILKDPYNFDFLTLGEEYQESDLERALTANITRFLLELGKGFTFYGRQVELVVSGKSYFVDMLFYHVRLKCFVAVELKTTEFKPEFAGKLNFYVTAIDNLLKQKDDRPTIGLLIFKTKDDTIVEWSFNGQTKPFGVASYEGVNVVPEEILKNLPTSKEVEQRLNIVLADNDRNL